MRTSYIYVCLIVFLLNSSVYGQKNTGQISEDSIETLLKEFNYKSYYGKKVSELLKDNTIKQFKEKKYSCYKIMHYLTGIYLLYTPNIKIEIYLGKTKYIKKKYDPKHSWDWKLIEKETIKSIKVYDYTDSR